MMKTICAMRSRRSGRLGRDAVRPAGEALTLIELLVVTLTRSEHGLGLANRT